MEKESEFTIAANYVKFYLSRGHLTLTALKKSPHGGFGGCSMVFTKKMWWLKIEKNMGIY